MRRETIEDNIPFKLDVPRLNEKVKCVHKI